MAGAGAGMMAGGAAVGAAVLAPISAFAEAEDSATQLRVAMMTAGGSVQAEYGQVVALAEKLGATLPGTTAEFQDMMRVLIQKGLDAKTVLGGAGEATAKLAVLTKVSFAESAEAISVFQDAMGVADSDMVSAADQMQRLYNVGMKITDIQEGFKAMGPSLAYVRKQGLDAVKELAPLLAITDAAGMDAGSAGNAYNKIIRGSVDAKKVAKANAELDGTGVKFNFVDNKGNFAGINHMVDELMKIQNLSDQKRKAVVEKIFGTDKEVAEALNAMMKSGNAGISQMREKLAQQASLQERVGAQLGTLKNLWDAAGGAFTGFLVKLGEAIAPQVKSLTQWISDVSDRLQKWSAENPRLAGTLMTVAGGLAIVLAIGGALMVALAALMGPMLIVNAGFGMLAAGSGSLAARLLMLAAGSFPALTSAVVGFGAALMATPIGWIIAGIAGIVAIGLVLYRYWDTIAAFFGGAFDGLVAGLRTSNPMFGEMLDYVSRGVSWVGELLGGLNSTSSELGAAASMGVQFGQILALSFDLALTPLKTLWATIKSVIAAYNEISAGNWSGALGAAANAFGSVWQQQSALNADMSDADRMARKSPLPAQTPLRAAGAGNATVTQNVSVTVNAPPGADAQATGQAAASATQRMMQQTARDTRAALHDRD
ncbi:phage tail tape measure protein [Rivihabitans pingtungensis]|nr:phage tail tape measure protein [Rivihabitans pingtungensis]